MGRIRTKYIKAMTKKLINENSGRFTKDFKKNKEVLTEIVDAPSKQLRNKVAGSIARTIKNVKE
jgi:ribosomal protein S17E